MAISTKNLLPSNARRRREIHIANDMAIKERKRVRKHRGRIHATLVEATQLVELSSIPHQIEVDAKATDVKIAGKGWQIMALYHDIPQVVAYAGSRDKARARAKAHNDGSDRLTTQAPEPITHDQAMLKLGWKRVQPANGVGNRGVQVDDQFKWVGVNA